MSRVPNIGGVQRLSERLRELDAARADIVRLEAVITERQRELEAAKAKRAAALVGVMEAMQEMDVASPGNHGYEGRLLELLRLLNTHAEEHGRLHP